MTTSFTMTQKTTGDKKISKSITDVNPEATLAQISALARGLNALTTNTLNKVERIDKTDIDPTETYYEVTWNVGVVEGTSSNYTLNGNTLTVKYDNIPTGSNYDTVDIKYTVNGQSYAIEDFSLALTNHLAFEITRNNQGLEIYPQQFTGTINKATFKQTITIPAGQKIIGQSAYKYSASTLTIILE